MKFLCCLTIFCLSLTACGSSSPVVDEPDEMVGRPAGATTADEELPLQYGALWYHMEPREETLAIRMRLLNPPERTTFFFPGPWAGHGDFDHQIILGHASGPDGPLPMAVDRGAGRIDVESGSIQWIELSYRIRTRENRSESHRFHPWKNQRAFFAYAPTILILPSAGLAEQLRDIPVELHIPAGWKVAGTWPLKTLLDREDDFEIAGFVVHDVRGLRDAFIGAGGDWTQTRQVLEHGELNITLAGEFQFDQAPFLEAAATIVDHYLQRFGIYDEITGVLLPTEDQSTDVLRGMGRLGGFILELPVEQQLDDNLLLLLAHEAFHSWNGHQLVPDPESDGSTRWFKEGVTHYIALKTLGRLGIVDRRTIRKELATAAQFYQRNPIISGRPVQPVDRARLPYDRGFLIALALDLTLLNYSNGALAIEDWIVTLLSDPFVEESRAYDHGLLRSGFRHLTADLGPGPIRRYESLIHSDEIFDIPEIFRELGLHYLDSKDGRPARALPIDDAESFEILFTPPSNPGLSP